MEKQDVRPMLSWLYESQKVPLWVWDAAGQTLWAPPLLPTQPFLPAVQQACLQTLQDGAQALPVIWICGQYYLGTVPLAQGLLVAGPCGAVSHSREELHDLCRSICRPETRLQLSELLQEPAPLTLPRFACLLALAAQVCGRAECTPQSILGRQRLIELPPAQPEKPKMQRKYGEKRPLTPLAEAEEQAALAIGAGDDARLKKALRLLRQDEDGAEGGSTERARCELAASAALWTEAAMQGGMDRTQALSLRENLVSRALLLSDNNKIAALRQRAAVDLCAGVQQTAAQSRLSLPIRRCCSYIARHLHDRIELSALAEASGLSMRSVSRRFRAETGLTVPNYVQRQRVQEAKYLLQYTDYSLQQISEILQFSSQSYFSQVFRGLAGMTPQLYRDEWIRAENNGRRKRRKRLPQQG